MSEIEVLSKEENTKMNWYVAAIMACSAPFVILVFQGHHWAIYALKVYIMTACIFVALLLFIERGYLGQKWLWIGMIPVLLVHCAFMYGLVLFNEAVPWIDRFAVMSFGALVPIGACETIVLYFILERFRPRA